MDDQYPKERRDDLTITKSELRIASRATQDEDEGYGRVEKTLLDAERN